jgi:fructose 1,6-bisphosphatase
MGNEEAEKGIMLKQVGEFEPVKLAAEGMEYTNIQHPSKTEGALDTAEENLKTLLIYSRQMG